jgi:hypothetical protein
MVSSPSALRQPRTQRHWTAKKQPQRANFPQVAAPRLSRIRYTHHQISLARAANPHCGWMQASSHWSARCAILFQGKGADQKARNLAGRGCARLRWMELSRPRLCVLLCFLPCVNSHGRSFGRNTPASSLFPLCCLS